MADSDGSLNSSDVIVLVGLLVLAVVVVAALAGGALWLAMQDGSSPTGGAVGATDPGRQLLAQQGCVACHSLDGTSGIGPSLKGVLGKRRRFTDDTQLIADADYLRQSILHPGEHIVAGYANAMPSYENTLTPDQVEALVDYLASLE